MGSDSRFGDVTIVIPAYEPDEKLIALLAKLREHFSHIVIVDDGSRNSRDIFEKATPFADKILVHEVNRGKGAALKTAFAYLGDTSDVITVDADGQHSPKDILKVANALATQRDGLVLGVRAFAGKVPFRSRFGNAWSRWLFFLLTRIMIRDTQTGLRGIPREMLSRIAKIPGSRYEYEMAMLADSKRHASKPVQIPIETIYIDGNATSHFQPLADTIRIYRSLFQFCLSSILSFCIDNILFATSLFIMSSRGSSTRFAIFSSLVIARFVSANFNYFYNRFFVFKSRAPKSSFFNYWSLVLAIAAASYGLTRILTALLSANGIAITAIKIFADTALFVASYWVQRKFIFKMQKKLRSRNKQS